MALENRLILALLQNPQALVSEPIDSFKSQAIHWQAFHARAHILGVKNTLYPALRKLKDSWEIPAWLLEDFEADYFKCAIRNTLIIEEFFILEKMFSHASIPILPIKGTGFLARNLYEDVGMRVLSDMDVMVRKENLIQGEALLHKLGYQPFGQGDLSAKEYLQKKNHLRPYLSPREIPVDLHWRFGPSEDASDLWRTKVQITYRHPTLGEKNLWVPSKEQQFLHAMVHLTKTDLFSWVSLVKSYLDVQVLLKRFSDTMNWDEIARIIDHRNLHFIFNWFERAMRAVDPHCAFASLNKLIAPNRVAERSAKRIHKFLWQSSPFQSGQEVGFLISWEKERLWSRKFLLLKRVLWPSRRYLKEESRMANQRLWRLLGIFWRGAKFLWPKRFWRLLRSPHGIRKSFCVLRDAIWISRLEKQLSLPEIMRRLSPSPIIKSNPKEDTGQNTVELVDWFLGLNKGPLQPNCLRRSLILFSLLQRQGVPVVFHCGLRKSILNNDSKDPLEGHSWLTLDGKPFCELTHLPLSQFSETYRFP